MNSPATIIAALIEMPSDVIAARRGQRPIERRIIIVVWRGLSTPISRSNKPRRNRAGAGGDIATAGERSTTRRTANAAPNSAEPSPVRAEIT